MHATQSRLNTHPSTPPQADESGTPLLDSILATLEDMKAEEIATIDLTGKSTIADHMVIANGRSQRQVAAIADRVMTALKDAGHGRVRAEGLAQADWVLIDAGDVVVHVFRPEVRSFYNLEKLWSANLNPELTH